MLGGLIAARWGWQAAFGVVGLPGLVLALLYMKVRDYPTVELTPALDQATRSISQVARHIVGTLAASRTMLWVCLGAAAQLIVVSAVWSWLPSFLNRVHGVAPGEAGVRAALVVLCGAIGSVVGAQRQIAPACDGHTQNLSYLHSCASRRLPRWGARLRGAAVRDCVVCTRAIRNHRLRRLLDDVYGGPVSAIVRTTSFTPACARPDVPCSALFQNLFGLALGPVIAGTLSDAWGLETALTAMPAFSALAAIAFMFASRSQPD